MLLSCTAQTEIAISKPKLGVYIIKVYTYDIPPCRETCGITREDAEVILEVSFVLLASTSVANSALALSKSAMPHLLWSILNGFEKEMRRHRSHRNG